MQYYTFTGKKRENQKTFFFVMHPIRAEGLHSIALGV
jgi:hypothetical protein